MKKVFTLFFLLYCSWAMSQQSITNQLILSVQNGGMNNAYFNIGYSLGNYTSKENDMLFIASSSPDTVFSLRTMLTDGNTNTDTTFTLSVAQLDSLNKFYYSLSNNYNPDYNLSTAQNAADTLIVTICCNGPINAQYNSAIHISLFRYLISNWKNWN